MVTIAPNTTLADLAWSTMNACEFVAHLEATHRQFLWSELPRLSALADEVLDVHGERHPELTEIADCDEALRADFEPHLVKEERILFPSSPQHRRRPTPTVVRCATRSR